MKKKFKTSAPGKLILLGEHAVVYGKPAIIGAIDKRCYATIKARADRAIKITSENLNLSVKSDEEKIIRKTKNANKKWQEFVNTNDLNLLKSITSDPLDYAEIIIGETLLFVNKKLPSGFSLNINSEITIGSGMGSSAALAVSIAAAVSLFLGEKFDKEKINEIAFISEQKKHGLPSGGDNSACCFGGFIWFRKETPDLKIIHPISFQISPKLQKNLYTVFSGTPKESTGELVGAVRALCQKKPEFVNAIFIEQEELTRQLLDALKNDNTEAIIQIIKHGERNLEQIGVVSPFARKIIKDIESKGGAAKICGTGGKTRGSGIILIYHQNLNILEKVLLSYDLKVEQLNLGGEGLREEI